MKSPINRPIQGDHGVNASPEMGLFESARNPLQPFRQPAAWHWHPLVDHEDVGEGQKRMWLWQW